VFRPTLHGIALCIGLVAAWSGPTVADAPCSVWVSPSGDPSLVEQLVAGLRERGIGTTQAARCPAVQVRVDASGARVRVVITDAYDRVIEREVDGMPTATTLVESWILQEVDAGRTLPVLPAAPTSAAPATTAAVAVHAENASSPRQSWLGVGLASAIGGDGTSWVGGESHGCFRLGAVCLGGTLRAMVDTGATGTTRNLDTRTRSFDGAMTAEIPVQVGRWLLAPGVSVGPSWVRVSGQNPVHQVLTVDDDLLILRGGAMLFVAHPLTSWLLAWGAVSADAELLGGTEVSGPTAFGRMTVGLRIGGQ